mmetsp:Transcript_33686/g.44435  ORF Transcript_33686/g.44435 Transcript_33686/m.44435 type:complete len:107 (+) Transcript_33686:165-485(+)
MMGYAKRECCSLVLGIIFMLGSASAEVIMPIFVGESVDLMSVGDTEGVSTLCAYFTIIFLFSGIALFMRSSIFNILSERISRNIRKDFFSSLVSKDIAFFDERHTG